LRQRAGRYSILIVCLVLAEQALGQQTAQPGSQQTPPSPPPAASAPASPPQTLAPQPPPFSPGEVPLGPIPPLSAIAAYVGLPVREIHFKGVPDREQPHLAQFVSQKTGQTLNRAAIRDSIRSLYATGLFYDIQVEADKTSDNELILTFVMVRNYFIGTVDVVGGGGRPSTNQLISTTKLQLGEIYTPRKLDRAQRNILQLMSDNGFYSATVTAEEHPRPNTSQMDLTFHLVPGSAAHLGKIQVTGQPGYSKGQIEDIAKMHSGDTVTAERVSSALQRIRKAYVKQKRLLVQVLISEKTYRPETNVVDYTFDIQPGPKVEIIAEGYKIRRNTMRKRVPVYEENAFDDDLLNEGRRNLLDYMQSKGYFEAKVGIKKESQPEHNLLRAIYVIDPGARYKLVRVLIHGNRYFDQQALRTRMQVQPATRIFSNGRYSQSLLASDISGLEDLYRANGFRAVQITSAVDENYGGKARDMAVVLNIQEGPQTLVSSLKIVGNDKVSTDTLTSMLSTVPGQPYSDYNLASDRDTILNYYFNNGFPNASMEVTTTPVASENDRMDVTVRIHEGQQFFVDQVLVSGLVHTRPHVVQRKLRVKPGAALSQDDLLSTQTALYDLGIFNQVDTAVQNPDGTDPAKNVLVDLHEAKRYTFNYGFGFEVQTGQPSTSANVPQGQTGASPRVSFEMTRLNFRGLDHTVVFKGNLGKLQQRALASYHAPSLWNNNNLTLSVTGFYDNTLDITTFTSKRLEGSIQLTQVLGPRDAPPGTRHANTFVYGFTYRRVQASNLVINPNLIPLLSQPTRVGFPGFTFIHDKRDNPIDSTRGNYTTVDLAVASKYFGSEADFGRMLFQNSTYYVLTKRRPAGHQFVLARSTRVGLQLPFGNTLALEPDEALNPPSNATLIPLPERFLSGGGNSHRGFGLNQAGPRDLNTGFPVGGSALFLNQVELRLPPVELPLTGDNLSFVFFHDMGNVFPKVSDMVNHLFTWRQKNPSLCQNEGTYTQCDLNYISHAVGIGVHYKTPIGPVRLDIGYNLNPPVFPSFQTVTNDVNGISTTTQFYPQRASHFNFFFSIGQSF
jgi:outer membrane protein insertion porin family